MLQILAFAKINLYLRIVGKLPDGYHALQTVMQTISLADRLQFLPNTSGEIRFSCRDIALEREDNLVIKACRLYFKTAGVSGGFDIGLEKNIPVAAGLGGGSSDAAATLNALNHFYGAPLKVKQLEEIGLQLGADVPFFIRGGSALAENKGEVIHPISKSSKLFYVLIKQGTKHSTGQMYAALDALPCRKDKQAPDFERLANDIAYLHQNTQNDFEQVSPINCQMQSDFCAAGAQKAMLSGSGPTCFAVFGDHASAKAVFDALGRKYPLCFLAEDTESGNLIV